MTGRMKHTEGFTLAEVMLAVAIILVLGALAFPSIVTTQNNMRILELSSAAESIANAAQTQMTAKKADGTWLPLIQTEEADGTHTTKFPLALNPPASGASASETFYMTAAQARDNGIVPAGSVDETVRAGDYVIEFTASTATVVGVFYADGKTGFFGDAPANTTAALSYYTDNNGTRRDIASRLVANPMIGYYEGTPSGATRAIALASPVVWMDDLGHLCVQNSNLTGNASDSAISVAITKKSDPSTGFVVAGLDGVANTFAIWPIGNDGKSCSYANSGDTSMYELTSRTATGANNVFSLDLNELSRIVQSDAAAQENGLVDIFNTLVPGEDLQAEAQVSLSEYGVPASARAFVQWPEKVAQLALFITDPALDASKNGGHATADHIKGIYEAPKTQLVTPSGGAPVTDISMHEKNAVFNVATHDVLRKENVESSRQAYSGGWVRLSDAYDQQANVKATVGSYTSAETGKTHDYQIYEMWINGQRVGYVKQNKWTWEKTDLAAKFRACVIGLDDETVTEDLSTITIDTKKLYDSIETNTDEGYVVYIRTTPKLSEVQDYFDARASELGRYLVWEGGSGTTGSRGQNRGAQVRMPFENEFGASSTVATWTVTTRVGTSIMTAAGGYPRRGDLRVYYSAAPAVAWSPDGVYSGSSVYTALPSCVLWLYEKQGDKSFVAQPAAFVRESRSGEADNFTLSKSDSADFEISYSRDYLFYRLVEYCDQDGNPLEGLKQQYVPYSVMGDEAYAAIAAEPEVEGRTPTGWLIEGESTWPENQFYGLAPDQFGTLVGAYDQDLAYGYVQMKAQYTDKPKPAAKGVGLMYLEFDEAGQVIGYQGCYTKARATGSGQGKTEELRSLPSEAGSPAIASWDYRVVVPAGAEKPYDVNHISTTTVVLGDAQTVTINGALYDSYSFVDIRTFFEGLTFDLWRSTPVITLSVNATGASGTYQCNLLSAAAVSLSSSEAGKWGKPESPWIVRTADQIIGYRGIDEAEAASAHGHDYRKDAYRQTHDIDMGSTARTEDVTFSGSFNGQGHLIANYRLEFDLKKGETGGLFVKSKNAKFNDMHLTVLSSEVSVAKKADELEAGFLVGKAESTAFTKCTVAGEGDVAAVTLSKEGTPVEVVFGLLAGKAESSSFADCTASNVKIVANLNGKTRCLGGLIGVAEEEDGVICTIESSDAAALVSNVEFVIGKAFGKGESAGCLVGEGMNGVDIQGVIGAFGNGVLLTTNEGPQSLDDIPIGDMPLANAASVDAPGGNPTGGDASGGDATGGTVKGTVTVPGTGADASNGASNGTPGGESSGTPGGTSAGDASGESVGGSNPAGNASEGTPPDDAL